MPPTGLKETVGVYAGTLRDEGYAIHQDENARLSKLESTTGGGMFQRTLRAARLDADADAPSGCKGDGEAIYRGYLQVIRSIRTH
jgi:hypothetical protein